MALISLDDLEGLDDDITDTNDITEGEEPVAEDRLLQHWRRVGATHQVSVPSEMTGPIHEMNRNSQQREPLPHATVYTHEKMGEVQWEERVYPGGHWAVVSQSDELYEQSISNAFMKLMRYICKENELGRYLGMTVPVISVVRADPDGRFQKKVLTAFFLPCQFQTRPPEASDPDVRVELWEPLRVVTRPFFGTTNEATVSAQVSLLWELLPRSDDLLTDQYMIAVYENPGVPQRRNEIWFIRRRPDQDQDQDQDQT